MGDHAWKMYLDMFSQPLTDAQISAVLALFSWGTLPLVELPGETVAACWGPTCGLSMVGLSNGYTTHETIGVECSGLELAPAEKCHLPGRGCGQTGTVCFQETKVENVTVELARHCLGNNFDKVYYLLVAGTRGGTLLAWDPLLVTVSNSQNREHVDGAG